jgi:hypothetical protein
MRIEVGKTYKFALWSSTGTFVGFDRNFGDEVNCFVDLKDFGIWELRYFLQQEGKIGLGNFNDLYFSGKITKIEYSSSNRSHNIILCEDTIKIHNEN